jgi:hypothetical protein
MFIHPNKLSLSVYRAALALCPSGLTYFALFYVVRPDVSDYAVMLVYPSGREAFDMSVSTSLF